MRTTAKVGKVALGISGDGTILEVLLNVLALVVLTIGLELLERFGLRHFTAHNCLVLLGQLAHLFLNLGEVVLRNHLTLGGHNVIEETILYGRTEAELDAGIELLERLGEQVGRGVPEGVLTLFVLKLVKRDGRIGSDGTV